MTNEISIKVTSNVKKEELDKFVSENPVTSIFQTPDMAEVYKRNKGCKPIILAAINENTNEILASLLAKKLIRKPGVLESFSTHSTIRGGPIFVDNKDGIKAVSLLLDEYNKIAEKEGILYTRIHPLNNTPQITDVIIENGYKQSGWQNFLIHLKRSEKEIWHDIQKPRRKNINRATDRGVTIEELNDKSQIPVFYDLVKETYRYAKFPLEDISNFEATFDLLVPKGMAKFYFAKHDGKPIAARLILLLKGMIYDWYAGSDRSSMEMYPNDLLVWNILKYGSENGYYVFDFEGGGEPGNNEGWVEFKRRFGGELISYGRYTNTHQPTKMKLVKNMFEIYKKIL